MIGFGKRKKILIDRLQYKLLRISLFHLTCIIFLFLVAIFSPVIVTLYGGASLEQADRASTEFLGLHKRIWPAVPLALLLISLHSVLISHRIAGPLYRFRQVFDSVKHGDLSVRAVLREKDYLGQEAESLNRMIEALESRTRSIENSLGEVCGAYSKLESALTPECRGELTSLGCRLAVLRDRMDGLRISDDGRSEQPRSGAGDGEDPVRALADVRS